MREVNGDIAQNARINIKYSGKKPKVSFSYPVKNKDSNTTGSMIGIIFLAWMIINVPLLMYLNWDEEDNSLERYNYKGSKDYNVSNYSEFLEYYSQPERIEYFYHLHNHPLKETLLSIFDLKLLGIFLYLFGTPCLIYFPFSKKWDGLFPDYQAFWVKKNYVKFTSKDIKQEDNLCYIELPIFYNVVCDFKATKDFSKHLNEFYIREYNFKHRTLKNKRKIQNEIIWYARWYFKEKPHQGYLEVIFK